MGNLHNDLSPQRSQSTQSSAPLVSLYEKILKLISLIDISRIINAEVL